MDDPSHESRGAVEPLSWAVVTALLILAFVAGLAWTFAHGS
jgi:hypothetical protein